MGIASLLCAVAGIVTMMFHYVNHSIILGIITTVLLIAATVIGLLDMRQQEKNGGIKTEMFNPGLLGHGIGGTVLVVGAILCCISNIIH